MAHSKGIRLPAVAGRFYDSDPEALRGELRGYLEDVGVPPDIGHVHALVSPHAGHMCSGPPAAHGYRQVQGEDCRRVVIIAPSHRPGFRGVAAHLGEAFRMPLGDVPLDNDFSEHLIAEHDFIADLPRAHAGEHSLEIQLPFLQMVLTQWRLVPLLVSDQGSQSMTQLGEALGEALGRDETRTLVVASSDLYHGHDLSECRASDQRCATAVEAFDARALLDDLGSHRFMACGGGPIAAAMIAARAMGARESHVLALTNSAETCSGPGGYVVGYLSAALCER
jgi:MEMO1 family protein